MRTFLLVTVLVVAALGAACGGGDDQPPEATTADGSVDPVLAEGRQIFADNCATCHQPDGSGGRGPRINDGRVVENYPDPADQIELVTNGRGGMPAFGERLGAEQIEAVVRYTREVLSGTS